eukprot:TRINITY_DN2342_c0_g1_i1.p1 TRINITY_DN2342_c0_g1~~TRINITY_DN2342_c0_g1_i1.p1  ORF type:complete len:186 (-),score=24.01 TRINITY_DN2342_c0_g1_i1:254-811(-)
MAPDSLSLLPKWTLFTVSTLFSPNSKHSVSSSCSMVSAMKKAKRTWKKHRQMPVFVVPLVETYSEVDTTNPKDFGCGQKATTKISERKHIIYVEDCADHVVNFANAWKIVKGDAASLDAAPAAESENVLANIDSSTLAFEDALLLWWPPPKVEGFGETQEVHDAASAARVAELIEESKPKPEQQE